MSTNIGIDLGTTNSLVAVVMAGKARCLPDDDGEVILPSAVRYAGGEYPLIGAPALEDASDHTHTTFTSIKRWMGRSMGEARAVQDQLTYPLADGPNADVVRFKVGDEAVTAVEISAWILRMLRMRAEEVMLETPHAVITVPAYFDDAQRQATKDAAKLAGIHVLRLLNEPTAAAIAYGLQENTQGVYAVFDLGGGTFDISILELTDGVFQVLSTAGDTQLGGDDFDRLVADEILAQAGHTGDKSALRAALDAARFCKHALTDADTVTINEDIGGEQVEYTLTRERFDALIGPTVEKTLASCKRAVKDAELEIDDIDGVVLVGGSTRVPLVRKVVGDYFGTQPFGDINPDQVVAMGAAMQADILTGKSELADELLLMDVVPLSLGIETMGGVVEKLIWRCTPIPATASETFTTHVDGQTAVDLHVLQGERELAKDNRSLARFTLKGIPGMPAGLPRVKVEFTVDADGILKVTAEEQYTHVEAHIDVQPSYGLEEDEIERMLEEAIDHAETDVDERLLIEARVEAEQIAAAVQKAIDVDHAVLKGNEREIIGQVQTALAEALDGTDRHRIAELSKKLDEVTAPFAQRRIERDLRLALEGQDAGEVAERLNRGL